MLEKQGHDFASFVTLTYEDAELESALPVSYFGVAPVVPTLVLEHVQLFLKRLRKVWPAPLRYFVCGEYGPQTGRPHYHLALFGFPNCENGRTDLMSRTCCRACSLVRSSWQKGNIYLGELTDESASYIAGYVTKKFTKEGTWQSVSQWKREGKIGRCPQFNRMSLKPGIGAIAIKNAVRSGVQSRKGKYVTACTDAPVVLRKSGSMLPLGRYLRRKWREALGRSPDTPQPVLEQLVRDTQEQFRQASEKAIREGRRFTTRDKRALYYEIHGQKIRSVECRAKIYQSKEKI